MEKIKSLFVTIAFVFLISGGCIPSVYAKGIFSASKSSGGIAKLGKYTAQDLIVRRQYERAKEILNADNVNEIDSAGNTALHCAAEMDNGELVEYLLSIGADSSIRNRCGDTAIHIAVNNKCAIAAGILAKIGNDIFTKDAVGESAIVIALSKGGAVMSAVINETTAQILDSSANTILHYIVLAGNEAALDDYIRKNLPLSPQNSEGKTPLMLAWNQAGSFAVVKAGAKLVLAGARLTQGDLSYFESALKSGDMMMRFSSGQTPLYIAATRGHAGVVAYIVKELPARSFAGTLSSILSVRGKNGETPLHKAVLGGNLDVVRLLLESGADANISDDTGRTPALLPVSGSDRYEIFRVLLEHGASFSLTDKNGNGIFHVASESGYEKKLLEFFLQSNIPVDKKNNKGVTPLSIAVERKNPEHILFYTKNGADINSYDNAHSSPLTKALSDDSCEMTKLLVTKASVGLRDEHKNSLLEIAVMQKASLESISYLVSLGSDLNAQNDNGDTALFFAALQNRKDVGELLLSHGADIFAPNKQNNSPLRVAFTKGEEVLGWLINAKNINSCDKNQNTPLHFEAAWKNDFAVSYLLEKGAKVGLKNAFGETPLFSAVKSDSVSTMELLLDGGSDFKSKKGGFDNQMNTLLHTATIWNAMRAAQKIISLGIDVNAPNGLGMTALCYACAADNIKMVRFLIENGADVNISDSDGLTLLMKAVRDGNKSLVSLLIESGADVSAQDSQKKTSYHYAAHFSSPEIIELLLNGGANPLAKDDSGESPFSISLLRDNMISLSVLGKNTEIADDNGETPAHIAVRNKVNAAFLSLLVKNGFPIDKADSSEKTPLRIAVESGLRPLALFLLSQGANPFQKTADGECALSDALKCGNIQILDGIVKYNSARTDGKKEGILHYAARYADEETVRHLVDLGVLKKSLRNSDGDTPEKLAQRLKRPEIAKLLK